MATIQDSKNLLVKWLNNNNVLKKGTTGNVQNTVNNNSATNVKSTGVRIPTATGSTDLKTWTKNKLQEKNIIPTTTTTTTQNNALSKLQNNPAYQQLQQLQQQQNVRYVANQNNQASRFIGFQNNTNNLPSTDLGGNIIQANVDRKQQEKEKKQQESLEKIKNRPVLNIPSKKNEIAEYNKKQSETYRTNENVIKDFHYDVQNSNGTLTKEWITQHYPEFQGKEDIALMLQADILPLVQNNEFADMKKLSEIYPELLPKQKKVGDKILKDQEKQAQEIKDWSEKAEKTLSRYNTLSKNGEKYLQDARQVGDFVKTIRKEYNLPGNPSDMDILNFGKENIPELKAILDDMEQLKSNFNLTEEDRNVIFKNGFDLGDWLLQAGADIQNFTQHNQLGDWLDKKSSTWERQLSNLGINGGSANTIANLPGKVLDTAEIPVNMVGGLASGVGKFDTALERITKQQNRNEDGSTDYNGIVKDVIKGGGGALEIGFNTVMAIPTAIFHLANETEAGKSATDQVFGTVQDKLDKWQSGEATNSNNAFNQWYNGLDKETKADLLNEEMVALFSAIHKGGKKAGGKVKKLTEFEIDSAKKAINEALQERIKIESSSETFKAKVEKGLADGTMKVSDDGILTDAYGNNIGKVKVTKEKLSGTDKVKYVVNKVIRDNRIAWNKGELNADVNMNALPDNRGFRDKAGERAYNKGVQTREVRDTAKAGVDSVKNAVSDIDFKPSVKGTAEAVGKGVKATSDLYNKGKNAVTQGKNKVTNAVKENVVDPFKKGYEGVKDTVKENVVDPYNKGRGKTTVNKGTVKQEGQPQESNSTLKSDTKVNGDNYTEKKTNSKTLNNTQLQIQQNENRMNPSEIREFKNRYKKDYGQVMYEGGFTKTRDENIDDMGEYINNLIKEKSDSISSIEGTYKDKRLAKMIKYMIRYASRTQDDAMFDKYNKLSSKHSKDGITTKEADDMRKEFSYKIKTGFWNDKNSEKIALATNLYSGVKDVLDEIAEANGFTDMRKINDEIAMRQHIRKGMIDKADGQSANNVYGINDYILMAEAFSNPETATLFVGKQLLKNKKIRNKVLNATVGGRKNAKNRITSESRQGVKNKIKSIAEGKKLQESMRGGKQPALPEYIKFSKITEIDKRKTTSEDTTPPTEGDTTEKKSETPKKESKPKNKVTAKKPVEKKTEAKTENKEEVKTEAKEQPKNTVTKKTAITEKKTEVKEEKKTEQPKEEKQLETRVETKQPEPKKDNVVTANERLKANGFEDIDTKGINLNNIDVKKMSDILNKSRDYRLGKDENGEYRVGYGDGTPKEKVNGDEAQLLMNIRDKKAPEEMKGYTGDKALTGAKLGYNKPTKNVVTEKAEVTTKSEPKKDIKANGGMKKQTGKSRAAKFTNTILDIIESNGGLKDGYLKVEKSGFEPLYIEEIGGGKIAVGQTYIQNGDVMFDPEIVFNVDDNGKLVATSYRNDSIGIYNKPMSPNSEFFDTWGENLKMFIKGEENLNQLPKEEVKTEEKPETKSDLTSKKSNVTAEPKKIDNSSITGKFRNLTLQDYKEMQKYQGVENQLINGDEEGYITGKIKAELLNTEKPLIPNAEIDESELYPVSYEDLKELVDKKKEIENAERKLMKKNDDNLSQQIEDLRYGYDNEMLPNLGIYEVEDVDTAVNIIESTMSEAHFQFFKDKEGIKPLVEKYGNYWEQGKSVDNKENTNIIGKNNTLTSKNNNNGTNLGRNEQTVGQSNGGKEGELRNAVSNSKSVESNETGLQRPSDTNGNGELNTSGKQADIHGDGLRAGHESTRLTVGEQRKINEQSRAILEKHRFSTNRSDYTPEELETLFKYEGNGGLAKAGDENVKGTRYEFYTPKNAVSALQRGIQKYSDSPINSVEDPTAGKGNMLDGYGENIDKFMYEISPVSGTIAKLRFPEAKVGIGEKDGDFQRRYLNYQGQKAYDTPRDGGHNVDAVLLNPPFGKRITIKDEPQIKSLEDYFTKRSIEHDLKDGGMVGLLMPSRWLKAEDSYTKKRLDEHTQIVDAYRLPAGVFSYTDVGTDLIILKKVAGADNKGGFVGDNYFKANPDKVLGTEEVRTGRHGLETYIKGDPKVIDTLWQDTDIAPTPMNKVTGEGSKTAITTKTTTPVENKPKNLVTNQQNNQQFKEGATETKASEKKPVKRTSKKAKQTISVGTKTDIGTYTANGNDKAYTYQSSTNADGYVDLKQAGIPMSEVLGGTDLLNYIDGKVQTDYLYFSGDIYAKLKQLEKDKEALSEQQYKKQKEGLQAILPNEVKTRDIVWSPTDKMLLEVKTDKLETYRDRNLGQEVNKPLTIREAFIERIRNLPGSQFNGTGTSKGNIADFVNGKRWSSERLSKRYDETDEEFAIRKKFKKAEEEQKKQATKERAWNFFNDFINDQLSPEVQKKITDSYNQRLRAVVKPDYKNMPLIVENMSDTFHGKHLVVDPVQIEGINAMLSKGTMLIAHGVGYGKTLEGVVATIASVQRGRTKKPLFIVPKGTREDWIKTIHELFPTQEVVDLGGLTVDDIKRLRQDLGSDVKDWIKEGQVAIVTHNGFNNKFNFKSETQDSIMGDLRDVMKSKDSTARQEDALDENVQNIAETMGKSKDTKKLKGIKAKLSERYGDELLEQLDSDIQNMSEAEFVENFITKADGKYPEKEMREDALKMYETKPIYIEDLGIDHITVDEAHNYKNIFTSAKSQKSQGGKEEVNPYGKITGSSSSRGRKMFATAQYILKNNNGRGVFSLTATPFNNQPIEVYNMLSLHAYNRLVEKGIRNINSFFDLFANFRTEFIYNSLKEGGGEYGEVMKDFNNLPEMQRLIGEYIDYVGDNPNLVRPEKKMRKVILKPSEKQVNIQNQLQKEEKRRAGGGESVLPLYTDMRLNIISPYLTSYGKTELGVPTRKEFIEDSPKLKFAVDTIKALRDEGHNDGVFIYMPLGVEFHELLKEAIEKTVGTDKVKVGIINGETTGNETVDGEKVEKRIAIADRFRKGELNVLIGGSNTSEGINLQDNGYITINTLIGRNPTEITQLNGRIHRQGNLRDHVIELLPLLTNGGDVMMMQKYDEKANRINNIFESQGRTFNLEELDPEEEKMALNTDPVRKAELSIDIDKKRLNRDIQKLSGQNGTLQEIISRMPKEEDIRESEEKIQKKQGELEQIKEGLKALDKDSSAYRSLEYEKESVERNIKNEKEYLKKLDKNRERAESRMQQYSIETIDAVKEKIKENEAILDDLNEQVKSIDAEKEQRIAQFTKEYEEWESSMKTPEEYIEDLKEDFRSKKIFADREELKQYLNEKKENDKKENKNKLTANGKNKITNS